MSKQRPGLAAISLLTLLVGSRGLLADTPAERTSLRGLGGVRVIVDNVPAEVAKHGLRIADLQTEIEARLKAAGIPLLAIDDRAQGLPTLHLTLAMLTEEGDPETIVSYWLELSLRQETRLTRAPSVHVAAATWQAPGTLGSVVASGLKKVRENVRRDADLFVAAYRDANRP